VSIETHTGSIPHIGMCQSRHTRVLPHI